MSKPKPHLEFVGVDMQAGWESPGPNYPPGFSQKMLASDIDEVAKRGSRTRLLKIEPGAYLHRAVRARPLGGGVPGAGRPRRRQRRARARAAAVPRAFTYACRPPGVHHGPFTTRGGCLLYEIHYYETSGKRG